MVAFARLTPRQFVLNPLVAPVGGAIAGLGVAVLFAAVPVTALEDWVWASGVQALVAAASPPLGTTARAVLAIAGGAMAASVAWSMLYLLIGEGGLLASIQRGAAAAPIVRWTDAHPDAPPRRPMTAAEMGTPLMEVVTPPPPVEQPLPVDLEQPLAAFDPGAIPDVPLTRTTPVAPLVPKVEPRQPLAPGERIETYVLTPPPATAAPEPRRGTAQPSIDALLRRLEDVAAQRIGVPAR